MLRDLLKQQKFQNLVLRSWTSWLSCTLGTDLPAAIDYLNLIQLQIDHKVLNTALNQAPLGSAQGPSGWTLGHNQAVAFVQRRSWRQWSQVYNVSLAGDMQTWHWRHARTQGKQTGAITHKGW
jgi:hypothetical protein